MTLDLVIRKFNPSDVDDLIALVDENQPGAVAEDKVLSDKFILDYANNPSSLTYFVAEDNGKLIGYVEGLPVKDFDKDDPLLKNVNNPSESYYCQEIFVSDLHRGEKISKKLYQSIIDYAIDEGYKEIIAVVSAKNINSLYLHKSLKMKEEPLRESIIFKKQLI